MTSSKPNVLALAKQGNPKAIAHLLNGKLNKIGINVLAEVCSGCLRIVFEGDLTPEESKIVPPLTESLKEISSDHINKIILYGRQRGSSLPDWQAEIKLTEKTTQNQTKDQEVDENTNAEKLDENNETSSNSKVDQDVSLLAHVPTEKRFGIKNIGSFLGEASQNAGNIASVVGKTTIQSASLAGGMIGSSTSKIASNVAVKVSETGKFIGDTSSQAISGLGDIVETLNNNPLYRQATQALQVDWIVKVIDQVDLVKAEQAVKNLQEKHPEDSPSQISHRLMISKLSLVASSGFVTSLVPGVAAPMMLVDFAATMGLQAEMVFQIAAAYGLDLHEAARKGEVLAIFGLSVGGNQALKLGSEYAVKAGFLGFLRNIPVAGAAIGASSNAALTYALGYAACRFYESKINPLSSGKALEMSQDASQNYLQEALSQQALMDQILVHIINAGNPHTSWEDILLELKSINISPESLEVIEKNLNSPPSLESLLQEVNQDFAIPLFLQCKKIAKLDNVITPEESEALEIITKKLDLDLAAILSD